MCNTAYNAQAHSMMPFISLIIAVGWWVGLITYLEVSVGT